MKQSRVKELNPSKTEVQTICRLVDRHTCITDELHHVVDGLDFASFFFFAVVRATIPKRN